MTHANFKPSSASRASFIPGSSEIVLAAQGQFERAFHASFGSTIRFLMSRGASADVAEEVAQAAWARAWEHRHQLQNQHLLRPWINSIAKNLLKNRGRVERRLEPLADRSLVCRPQTAHLFFDEICELCGNGEAAGLIRDFYLRGYTAEEIGRRAGVSASAVRVRLFRLRENLRAALGATSVKGDRRAGRRPGPAAPR